MPLVPRRSTVSTWIIPSSVIMIEITAQEPKKKRAAAAAATYFSWQIWSRPLPHLHRAPPVSHPPMLPCRGRLRRVPLGGIQDRPGGCLVLQPRSTMPGLPGLPGRQGVHGIGIWYWQATLLKMSQECAPHPPRPLLTRARPPAPRHQKTWQTGMEERSWSESRNKEKFG